MNRILLGIIASLVLPLSSQAGDGTIRGAADNASIPGLSSGTGDDRTLDHLMGLRELTCVPKMPARFWFDSITGNDSATATGSRDDPFRSMTKAASVCIEDRVECLFTEGRAWGQRFPLTNTSGVFTKGELVTYANGSAILLDYDPVEAVGIFEDRLEPQSIHTTEVTSGNITITHNGATTGNITFDASAATVESALEGLANVTDAVVTGAGTSGDPWVIAFDDPPRPAQPLTATNVDLSSGSVVVTDPRLGDGVSITGATSGATADTGTGENTFDSGLVYATSGCDSGELCAVIRSTGPEPAVLSANSKSVTGGTFLRNAGGADIAVGGIELRRLADAGVEARDGSRVGLLNWYIKELIQRTTSATGFNVLRTSGTGEPHIWSLNGRFEHVRHGTSGNAGDSVRIFDNGSVYMLGKGTLAVGPGGGKNAPLLAVSDGGTGIFVGHFLDYREAPAGYSPLEFTSVDGLSSLSELHRVALLGDVAKDVTGILAITISDINPNPTVNVKIRNSAFFNFQDWLFLSTLEPESAIDIDVASTIVKGNASGRYIVASSSNVVEKTTLRIETSLHDDDAQTGDWLGPNGTYDTLAAFLADADIASAVSDGSWVISGFADGTGEQWVDFPLCDSSKECHEGYGVAEVVTFPKPFPDWLACEEIRQIRYGGPNENIGL